MKFWQIFVLISFGSLVTCVALVLTQEAETRRTVIIMLASQGGNTVGAALALATNRWQRARKRRRQLEAGSAATNSEKDPNG